MSTQKPFDLWGQTSKNKASAHPSQPAGKVSKSGVKSAKKEDSETFNMLNKMKQLHDELEVKLDQIYQKSGLDPLNVKNYLSNPDNFNYSEWERIQTQRESMWSQMGLKSSADEEQFKKEQNLNKANKGRKSKSVGARRNWIPIR